MAIHIDCGQRRATFPEDVAELTLAEVFAQLNASAVAFGDKPMSEAMLVPRNETSLRRALRGLLREIEG